MKQGAETSMRDALANLVTLLITEYGYGMPAENMEGILSAESYHAEDFARDVLVADGLDVDRNLQAFRSVRNLFVGRFGHFVWESDFEEDEEI